MPEHCSYEGCTRDRYRDQDKCIFHCEEKDPQEFRNALAAQIREWRRTKAKEWDFRGWVFVDVDRRPASVWPWKKHNLFRRAVFPVNSDFQGARFETAACFMSARFLAIADFTVVRFSRDADFRSVYFTGDARFISAQFAGVAHLTSAQFVGNADLSWANFTGSADFAHVQFTGYTVFRGARFAGTADFARAEFTGDVDFREAKFTTDVSFSVAEFEGEADFSQAQFSGVADFSQTRFTGNTYLRQTQFTGDAHFGSAQFTEDTDFGAALFTNEADFSRASFSHVANFEGTEFRRRAAFLKARFFVGTFEAACFSGPADFHSVICSGSMNYNRTQFNGKLFLPDSVFLESVWFMAAEFASELSLEYACFGKAARFEECRIRGHIRVFWPGEGAKRVQPREAQIESSLTSGGKMERGKLLLKNLQFSPTGVLDLRRNSLAPDCELAIEDCDMSRVLLEGTDCTKIRFYNCAWPVKQGRLMIADELLGRPYLKRGWLQRAKRLASACLCKRPGLLRRFMKVHPNWSLIALTYQQLARRFREDFNHSVANDFDRGVFEMRRLLNRSFWVRRFGLTAWYGYLSNYGGSYRRPVGWLLAVTGLCSIYYQKWLYCGWVPSDGLAGIQDGLVAALRVSGLSRNWLVTATEACPGSELPVTILATVQVVLTALLVTLLIFAVRRRFRHG